MSFLKTIFRISVQNIRKWQTDYRIWVIAVFLLVMTLVYVDDLKRVADAFGFEMNVWIFPFIYSQWYYKIIFTLPLALMLCDAPFIDKNQLFVMMRTPRTRWLCGQLLYIFLASGIYYLYLFVITVLTTVVYGDFSFEWGELITALAFNPNLKFEVLSSSYFSFSKITVEYFTPLSACWFTFLMSWLSGTFLGLVIFLCNLFSGMKILGVAVSGVFIVLTISANGWYMLDRFSPVSWSTLNQIDVGGLTTHPSFTYCVCVLLGLIILLIAAVLLFGRQKNYDVKGDQ